MRPKPEGYNRRLESARIARNWHSQERAAAAATEHGRRLFGDPGFEITTASWRRWESPKPGRPYPKALECLCDLFQASSEDLGFATPKDIDPAGQWAHSRSIIGDVKRRDLLAAGGTAALGALPWLSPAVPSTGMTTARVGEDELDHFQKTLADLDALDQRIGGAQLWRLAKHTLETIHGLLQRAEFTPAVGAELRSLAGSLTTSLGWYCYDADERNAASIYFSQALNTALLTGDSPLAVRTLSNMSRQAVDLGNPRDAVQYAQTAAQQAATWAPPRVHSLLAIREAQGRALLGDRSGTDEAVLRAWRHFERGAGESDPDWTNFLNEAELTCLEGMARSDLGQHPRAVELLERSTRLQDAAHGRNLGMCLVRLAGAALGGHDLDRALDAVQNSLDMIGRGMNSPRTTNVLSSLTTNLTHYDDPRAGEMIEQISAVAA
ncbi:hypothetical protein [Kitasatospora sp. NPDC088134]|uniref:hypothetical protein n=1 Tax=Kitasatospora sp. NPDC088134 TaxID=3364071 RepID=UPI0037F873F2